MKKTICIGVDQTGAVDRAGRPKALPACLIIDNQVSFFYLKTFSKESLFETLQLKGPKKVAVCVDCVLGLPQELNVSWRRALELIKSHEGFGRDTAQKFFFQLGRGQILSRKVEIQSRANSVFKEKPFQKNIQTGTYRIWKEMASTAEDFAVPFLQETAIPGQILLFEGYPSLSWKLLFGVKSRMPAELPRLVRLHFPELDISRTSLKMLKLDANLADAFVLALSLKKLPAKSLIEGAYSNEGWILGQE